MDYKAKLKRLDAEIKWQFKRGFKEIVEMNINLEIPLSWSFFMNTKDEWIRLPLIEAAANVTAFLYKPEIGSTFFPHVHPNHAETIFMRMGSAMIYTPYFVVQLNRNESITIPKGVPHILDFDNEKQSLMEISYHPKMEKGWEGTFLNS
jgi:mannose-6-phosphate isomerase-like protein (cupin superfamily)|tara:strand:- start:4 stop:450 length:447 start_codon:yes stop_codon:yes gene_type:complete